MERSWIWALFIGLTLSFSSDEVNLCARHPDLCYFKSYSGFADVDAGSLFYWYFEPNVSMNVEELPLILWLQGGPGASSMMGTFFELGPVSLSSDGESLLPRRWNETWISQVPVVFVDSPVGTGWSFAKQNDSYAKSQDDVAHALGQFLEIFASRHVQSPLKRRLVLAGESYGGHFIPSLGNYLLKTPGSFHLDAIMVGDGLTDPGTQVLTKPSEAFALGLLDEKQRDKAQHLAQQAHDLVEQGRFVEAADFRYAMEDFVKNVSLINPYDVRTTEQYGWQQDRMKTFFNKPSSKELLHIPQNLTFGTSPQVHENLKADIMKSQKSHVESLLKSGVRVLLYQGQFDWKDGFVSNAAWIRTLSWAGTADFLSSKRHLWRRGDGEIAGYWKKFENLEQVLVLGAGHLVPMNQPLSAVDMMQRFLRLSHLTSDAFSDAKAVIV